MSEIMTPPINHAAEWSVLSKMLTEPALIGEVIGVPLLQGDFSEADTRLLYQTTVERHYAGKPVDPLIVGELVRDELSSYWGMSDNMTAPGELLRRVREAQVVGGSIIEHAAIVKKLSTSRQLLMVCYQAVAAVNEGRLTPEEIGDQLSTESLQITSGTLRRSELLSWMDTGTEYVKALQRKIIAKKAGVEIGVYTGLEFIDRWTAGIGPGELCFLAGDPGVGKTAVAWAAALGFAHRQAARQVKADQRPVATLMLSLEMNLENSTARMVSALTGIDGVRLREGVISEQEYRRILTEWKNRESLPIAFNFASNFRLSQMRALIAEGIRRANVGFVVIDHFRMIDTDRHYTNPNQEDEAKVRFLKENIAKDLNVAVMCLAHTSKVGRGQGGESPRPRLTDLRGSGMIAAHADFVGMLWSPYKYMSDEARREMAADPADMELAWEKNRYGQSSTASLRFDAPTMKVLPR